MHDLFAATRGLGDVVVVLFTGHDVAARHLRRHRLGEDIKRHRTVGAAIAEPGDTAELDDSTRKPLSVVMVLPSSTGQPIRAAIPQKAPR
jgi:hypothetical protein